MKKSSKQEEPDFIRPYELLQKEPQEVLQAILLHAVKLTGADSGSLMLLNPNTGVLDVEASYGFSSKIRELRLARNQGITGWVASTGEPLRVGDVSKEKRYVEVEKKIRSELAVPLCIDGQVIGILNVDSRGKNAFSEKDQRQLMNWSAQACKWLEAVWELNRLRKKADQLKAVVEIGQMVVSQHELDKALARVAREARLLMKARICSIMLLSDERTELVLKAWDGASKAYIRKPNIPVVDSLVGVVLRHSRPLAVLDVREHERYLHTELAKREGLVSLLSVPLVFESRAMGVLSVYTDHLHRFSNEEIQLLATMADLCAVAIGKSMLVEHMLKMEENLKSSERLSALGWLAAEVAHEIRNPLTVMQMVFHTMVQGLEMDDVARRDAVLIENKMQQLNRIVEQVLAFARSSEPAKSLVKPNAILEDVCLLVRHKLADQGVELRLNVEKDLPELLVDRSQIEQAVLNLILNACGAMEGGGVMTLSAKECEREGKGYVSICVKDTGLGIGKAMQEQLFEPFLSQRSGGTGLGLAIVKKIIDHHQGLIEIKSRKGRGTQVSLLLSKSREG